MSNLVGIDGVVTVGGTSIGSVNSFVITMVGDQVENTSMGEGAWRTMLATLKSWNGSVNLYFDNADSTQALLLPNALLTFEFFPEDDSTTGNYVATGSAFVSNIDQSSEMEAVISRDVTFVGTGELVLSTVS